MSGLIDKFKLLKDKSKDSLMQFKDKFQTFVNNLYQSLINNIIQPLINSLTKKDNNIESESDIKDKLNNNPIIKSVLSEIDIFNEVKNELTKKDVNSLLAKETDKNIKESVDITNKYVIFEGIGDTVDDISTKIFNTVYQLLVKGLSSIGYTINPELRNWFDRLVRKVFKLFQKTKLGQSIEELPPDVKKDVILKFQAIIGIVISVVIIWIIISTLKGEDIDNNVDNAEINSKNTDISDVSDTGENASTPKMYLKEGGFNGTVRYGNEPREFLDLRRQYIQERVDAISEANPKLSAQTLHAWEEKAKMEFDASFAHGKVLNINDDGKIISLDKENLIQSFDDPKEYLKTAGALNGDTANLDVMQNLDDKYTASELVEAGINTVKFEAYGIPVNIDISKIPESDKNLNPLQLAEKYIKKVAEQAAAAKATEEELGI